MTSEHTEGLQRNTQASLDEPDRPMLEIDACSKCGCTDLALIIHKPSDDSQFTTYQYKCQECGALHSATMVDVHIDLGDGMAIETTVDSFALALMIRMAEYCTGCELRPDCLNCPHDVFGTAFYHQPETPDNVDSLPYQNTPDAKSECDHDQCKT